MLIRSTRPGISRRALLKGLGASFGLPLLDVMRPLQARGEGPLPSSPMRMGFLFMPNGVNVSGWTPKGQGKEFEFSPTLKPLEAHRPHLTVLDQLWNQNSQGGDGHYVKVSGWLTGTTITKTVGHDLRSGGPSVDQVYAAHVGGQTRIPSLELGIDPITSGVDRNVGYTRLYGSHVAWKSSTTPLPCEVTPRYAFNRVFRGGGLQLQDSVVDVVKADANRLRGSLGKEDQVKLDGYLDAIRALEKRIERDEEAAQKGALTDPAYAAQLRDLEGRLDTWESHANQADRMALKRSGDPTEQMRLMLDIMALAFYGDATRAATFMFGNAVSGRNFSFVEGVNSSHHQVSHHENNGDKLAQYQRINEWHVRQFAYFLDRLAGMREGDRTVLDNSLILFGSGFRDGNAHDPHNLPLVLAGHGGGRVQGGQYLVSPRNTPLCNLFTSMLQAGGMAVDRFSDATGPLVGLGGSS